MTLLIAFLLFALAVYLFIHFIVKRDRGRRESKASLFAAMGFGVLAVIAAGELNGLFVSEKIMEHMGDPNLHLSFREIAVASLTVGFIEESLKCIPLALFIYKKKYFDELTDGIIYFGIVALTFGIIEDVLYAGQYGGATGIFRIITAPYLHAGFTVLFGLALAYRKVLGRSWWFVLGGYMLAIFAHALYDFFAFSGSGLGLVLLLLVSVTLNVGLFVLFRRAQKNDEGRGQSAIGTNKFCRHCGHPNPKRMLYCARCGKLS